MLRIASAAFRLAQTDAWSPWRRLMVNGLLLQVLALMGPGRWVSDHLPTQVFLDTTLFSASITLLLTAMLAHRRRPASVPQHRR